MKHTNTPHFDPKCDGSRWVAYFDLLGMRARLRNHGHLEVFNAYQQAIKEFVRNSADHAVVSHAWFSDTFLLATIDDSGKSFVELEQACRWFVYFMLTAGIPLKGAIACGHMYADFEHGIFIGDAMVEAYDYGEGQDWIGLLLCPSATAVMAKLGIPVEERLSYALWAPSWKEKPASTGKPADAPDQVGACILGNWGSINGKNACVEALQVMASECPPKDKVKYERALLFIATHQRTLGVDREET